MTAKISDVLDRRHVVPGLAVPDKTSLLAELADRAGLALKLDGRAIAKALADRERLGSTGTGGGIAIPHARLDGLETPFGLFARIEPAIDFDAIDGKKVDLVFLLLTPTKGNTSHLALLAAISRRFRDPAALTTIRQAANAKEIFAALAGSSGEGS